MFYIFYRSELLNRRDKSHNNASTVIESYDDLLEVLYSSRAEKNQVYNETIEEICRGLVGWPGFENVFTISALHGDGIEDLSHYLMEKAYPSYGYWEYNQNLVTTKVTYVAGLYSGVDIEVPIFAHKNTSEFDFILSGSS